MYVYIEMRARFSSIDRFVEKLFAGWIDENEKRKRRNEKRERKKKKKKKKRERKLNGYKALYERYRSFNKFGSRLRNMKSA